MTTMLEKAVKERGLLMSGQMVHAYHMGRKGLTRRILKLPSWAHPEDEGDDIAGEDPAVCCRDTGCLADVPCPYGKVGDRLWVKETWKLPIDLDSKSPTQVAEAALEAGYRKPWAPIRYEAGGSVNEDTLSSFGGAWGKTRVSIHMPRWASRICLEITALRAERLQDITYADAQNEGLAMDEFPIGGNYVPKYGLPGWQHRHWRQSPVDAFQYLWETLHAQPKPVKGENGEVASYVSYPWDGQAETKTYRGKPWLVIPNPWVWVIEFPKLKVRN